MRGALEKILEHSSSRLYQGSSCCFRSACGRCCSSNKKGCSDNSVQALVEHTYRRYRFRLGPCKRVGTIAAKRGSERRTRLVQNGRIVVCHVLDAPLFGQFVRIWNRVSPDGKTGWDGNCRLDTRPSAQGIRDDYQFDKTQRCFTGCHEANMSVLVSCHELGLPKGIYAPYRGRPQSWKWSSKGLGTRSCPRLGYGATVTSGGRPLGWVPFYRGCRWIRSSQSNVSVSSPKTLIMRRT
mmetsp:Transcript_17264/g.31879  ORF Transcript_17264/g.31879 Transcript_17264/m.31879 type:complete len:238 (+) Transcript_17264:484-1197(+)